jgi:hypothetical protein
MLVLRELNHARVRVTTTFQLSFAKRALLALLLGGLLLYLPLRFRVYIEPSNEIAEEPASKGPGRCNSRD